MEDRPARNGPSARPTLPWVLVAIAAGVAVISTTGFVYLLAKRTEGPGEVLNDFHQAAHNGDCDAAFVFLADPPTGEERERACEELRRRDYPPRVRVEETVLRGDVAEVTVGADDHTTTWRLVRSGRTWRIEHGPAVPEFGGLGL